MNKQAASPRQAPQLATTAPDRPRRRTRDSFEEIDIGEVSTVPVSSDPLPPSNGGSGG